MRNSTPPRESHNILIFGTNTTLLLLPKRPLSGICSQTECGFIHIHAFRRVVMAAHGGPGTVPGTVTDPMHEGLTQDSPAPTVSACLSHSVCPSPHSPTTLEHRQKPGSSPLHHRYHPASADACTVVSTIEYLLTSLRVEAPLRQTRWTSRADETRSRLARSSPWHRDVPKISERICWGVLEGRLQFSPVSLRASQTKRHVP